MTRTGFALSLTLCGALALSGCGAPAPRDAPIALGDVTAEAVALQAVGFATELDEAAASPSPSAAADRQGVRPRAIRKQLRKNTLHGEVVVESRDGVKTVVVQRGAVTAADDAGFTVTSTDGFTLSWAYGDPLRVVQDRKKAERSAVRDGAQVAVGGLRDGSATAARLIVID